MSDPSEPQEAPATVPEDEFPSSELGPEGGEVAIPETGNGDASPQTSTNGPVVYLHIGTMKSGTSYIQGMLWRNRDALRSRGVLYPGATWQDQVAAVRDITAANPKGRRQDVIGAWAAMRDEMLSWSGGKTLVSMELLSLAPPERQQAVVESLVPAEVQVIITARDLGRVIPSAWQESTQNRQTWTWPAYLSSVTGENDVEPVAFRRFWRQHDVSVIATQWAAAVGADHVHVIVVPPPGQPRDELWRRFCSVVGLDTDAYDGADKVRGNPAVGAASAEFLRRLNVAVGRQLDIASYEQIVKRFLAKTTLAHRTNESRLVLPESYNAWAVERAAQMIDGLRQAGVRIVGDLDELVPSPGQGIHSERPHEIDEGEVAEAGMHAVEALVLHLAAMDERPVSEGRRRRRERRQTGEP